MVHQKQLLDALDSAHSFRTHAELLDLLKTGERDEIISCVQQHAREAQAMMMEVIERTQETEETRVGLQ